MTSRPELIAGLADRWRRQGSALPAVQRRRIVAALAEDSPMFGSWHRWERLFTPLYWAGVSCQGAGVLALALEVRPLLVAGLVFAGTITNASVAAHVWRAIGQALDVAAGLVARRDPGQPGP